jgi:hypothetical protein
MKVAVGEGVPALSAADSRDSLAIPAPEDTAALGASAFFLAGNREARFNVCDERWTLLEFAAGDDRSTLPDWPASVDDSLRSPGSVGETT